MKTREFIELLSNQKQVILFKVSNYVDPKSETDILFPTVKYIKGYHVNYSSLIRSET